MASETEFHSHDYESTEETASFIRQKIQNQPKLGIICGSGLAPLADLVNNPIELKYEDLPHFPKSTAPGHKSRMISGTLNEIPVLLMQGRFHLYEGYSIHKVIRDHVNLLGMVGVNPLIGSNDERFGPRFFGLSNAYDKKWRKIAKNVAQSLNLQDRVKEGTLFDFDFFFCPAGSPYNFVSKILIWHFFKFCVYIMLSGPNFETPAELTMLKSSVGVDAVGMSTVHEVLTARHMGMKAFAFSLITNKCVLDNDSDDEEDEYHSKNNDVSKEVFEATTQAEPMLKLLMAELVKELAKTL